MADVAATDVAYSALKRNNLDDGRLIVQATVVFGDGALTYPTGGIPITKAKLACPRVIDAFWFNDASNGDSQIFKYDLANNKIRIYKEGGGTYSELSGAFAAITVKVNVIGY